MILSGSRSDCKTDSTKLNPKFIYPVLGSNGNDHLIGSKRVELSKISRKSNGQPRVRRRYSGHSGAVRNNLSLLQNALIFHARSRSVTFVWSPWPLVVSLVCPFFCRNRACKQKNGSANSKSALKTFRLDVTLLN